MKKRMKARKAKMVIVTKSMSKAIERPSTRFQQRAIGASHMAWKCSNLRA